MQESGGATTSFSQGELSDEFQMVTWPEMDLIRTRPGAGRIRVGLSWSPLAADLDGPTTKL